MRVCRPPTAVHSRRPIQALLILGGLFYIFAIYYSVRLISKFSPFLNDALSMAAVCTSKNGYLHRGVFIGYLACFNVL